MKRKTYVISDEQGNKIIKHSWNTALRAMPDLIKPKLAEGESATIIQKKTAKDVFTGEYWQGDFLYQTSNFHEYNINIFRVVND